SEHAGSVTGRQPPFLYMPRTTCVPGWPHSRRTTSPLLSTSSTGSRSPPSPAASVRSDWRVCRCRISCPPWVCVCQVPSSLLPTLGTRVPIRHLPSWATARTCTSWTPPTATSARAGLLRPRSRSWISPLAKRRGRPRRRERANSCSPISGRATTGSAPAPTPRSISPGRFSSPVKASRCPSVEPYGHGARQSAASGGPHRGVRPDRHHPVGVQIAQNAVVVLLDLLEMDGGAEFRDGVQVFRVAPQVRHLGEFVAVGLEDPVVGSVEPSQ